MGAFGATGATGYSAADDFGTWLKGRKISRMSFELWLIHVPKTESPGRRSRLARAPATVLSAVIGSCGQGYEGERFASPVYARSMRKPYVTEAPDPPGVVTGSSVGAGQTLPFDVPSPPQPAAMSAATSGSARPSRARMPLVTFSFATLAPKDKNCARLPARRTCNRWAICIRTRKPVDFTPAPSSGAGVRHLPR